MSPIRTLIVDDEALARENLRLRLGRTDDFVIVGECGTGGEAITAIRSLRPELVFLDIRMPDLDGFTVIERLDPESLPVVVFVTAFDRYAMEAFRVHALDYLLKPFEEERFLETLQVCRRRVAQTRQLAVAYGAVAGASTIGPNGAGGRATVDLLCDRLVIKSDGRVFFLRIGAVDWIEAYGDYVRLHVGTQSHLLRRTMNQMEVRLPPREFARVSRTAIVNLDRVKDLVPVSRGELMVRLAGGRELKLTRIYRERLETLLGDRL